MKKKVGIFIGRLNPPHLGHLSVIKKALEDNDYIMLFLGSSNIKDNKNPFSYNNRKEMLKLCFNNKKLIINSLDDYEKDIDWINSLKNIIFNNFSTINKAFNKFNMKNIKLNIYSGDLKNDYAIKVINKYKKEFDFKLNFIEISRKKLSIKYKGEEYTISSTQIRQALKNKDFGLVKKMLNIKIYDYLSI